MAQLVAPLTSIDLAVADLQNIVELVYGCPALPSICSRRRRRRRRRRKCAR